MKCYQCWQDKPRVVEKERFERNFTDLIGLCPDSINRFLETVLNDYFFIEGVECEISNTSISISGWGINIDKTMDADREALFLKVPIKINHKAQI